MKFARGVARRSSHEWLFSRGCLLREPGRLSSWGHPRSSLLLRTFETARSAWGAITGLVSEQSPVTDADMVGLPRPIAADLLEASTCCDAGAYRAAALLARRAVEQVVVMRGVPLDFTTLHQKLVWLLKSGHLPVDLADAARTVRDVGNAASHGAEAVTPDEAKAIVLASLTVVRGALPATSR